MDTAVQTLGAVTHMVACTAMGSRNKMANMLWLVLCLLAVSLKTLSETNIKRPLVCGWLGTQRPPVLIFDIITNYQLPITKWPRQSGAPVGAAPPTRSQLRLQRHTQFPVQAQTMAATMNGESVLMVHSAGIITWLWLWTFREAT